MLDLERIRQMTKLASYEAGEGKTYLPISKYYRSDFIGLALIKNFFLVSIGYCMILAVIAGYNAEYLLNNAHKLNVVTTVIAVVAGYVVFHCNVYLYLCEVQQGKEEYSAVLHRSE